MKYLPYLSNFFTKLTYYDFVIPHDTKAAELHK